MANHFHSNFKKHILKIINIFLNKNIPLHINESILMHNIFIEISVI